MVGIGADILIIGVILFLALKGIMTGFVREFFNTLGLVGGIYLASHLNEGVADTLKDKLFHGVSIATLKFILFISILGVIWWLLSLLGRLLSDDNISFAMRVGGYFVALFKYFIVISLILFVLLQTPSIKNKSFSKSVSSSKIYSFMQKSAKWLLNGDRLSIKSGRK